MRTSSVHVGGTALLVALVLTACGGSGTDPGTAPPERSPAQSRPAGDSLTTGFEDGSLGPVQEAAAATVTSGAAHTGSFGLDVDARGTDAYARWTPDVPTADRTWWTYRSWIRIVSWTPGESVDLFTVRNLEELHNFDLFVDTPDRAFRWDLYQGDTASASGAVQLGQWHLVEAKGSFGTDVYTADVRVDGTPQPSIASRGQEPSAVQDLVLGPGGTTKTNRIQFDDVSFRVGGRPLDYPDALVGSTPSRQ
jgi:hypothetical protein